MTMTTTTVAALVLALAGVAFGDATCCEEARTIEAQGVSFADVPENRTVVRLNIYVEGPSAFDAINNIESVTRQATDFLNSQEGVAKVSGTYRYIYPDYNYNYNQQTGESSRTLRGYRSGGAITFEVDAFGAETLEGVVAIDGIEFSNIQKKESYAALQAGQKEAMKYAVYEARIIAEKMIETDPSLKVGKVLKIKGSADSYLSYAGGESRVVKAQATVAFALEDSE